MGPSPVEHSQSCHGQSPPVGYIRGHQPPRAPALHHSPRKPRHLTATTNRNRNLIDLLHKSLNSPYPTMHYFVTEICICVHISVTKWCIVGYVLCTVYNLWPYDYPSIFWSFGILTSAGKTNAHPDTHLPIRLSTCTYERQWPMTYLMTLSDWTMSCQPGSPHAHHGQCMRYKQTTWAYKILIKSQNSLACILSFVIGIQLKIHMI